jgi:hypothetical protein
MTVQMTFEPDLTDTLPAGTAAPATGLTVTVIYSDFSLP